MEELTAVLGLPRTAVRRRQSQALVSYALDTKGPLTTQFIPSQLWRRSA